MEPNLTQVLEQVSKDKGIDVKVLLQTLEQAILTAAKKVFGLHRELEAQYNEEIGAVDLFQICYVVPDKKEDGTDPSPGREITISAASPSHFNARRIVARSRSISRSYFRSTVASMSSM